MLKPVKWIVEDFHADNGLTDLIPEIKKQGHVVDAVTYVPFRGGTYPNWSDDEHILYVGSINLAQQIWDERPRWRSGIWATFEKYDCTAYLPIIGKHCLNSDHVLMPFDDVWENRWKLMEMSSDACVFIRPNAGCKEFTGAVVDMQNLEHQLRSWKQGVSEGSVVVVSSPKNIKAEWRNIVVNHKGRREVVASSLSMLDRHRTYVPGAPKPVVDLATLVLHDMPPPDPMYAIDVALLDDDTYKVVEINAFSTCGFYACPKEPIVRVASEVAHDLWNDLT